jgi:hypothetical protein
MQVGLDTVLVYDPTGTATIDVQSVTPLPATLSGLRIGVLENTKQHAAELMEHTADLIAARLNGVRIATVRKENAAVPATPDHYAWLAKECDVVLTGSGD